MCICGSPLGDLPQVSRFEICFSAHRTFTACHTVRRDPISHKELVVLTPVSMQSGINLMQRSVNFFPGSGLCPGRSQWRIKAQDGKWLITFPRETVCQDLVFQFLLLSSSQSVVGPADSAKLNFKMRTDVQMGLKLNSHDYETFECILSETFPVSC